MPEEVKNLKQFLADVNLTEELAYSEKGQIAVPKVTLENAQQALMAMSVADELPVVEKVKKVMSAVSALSALGQAFHQQKRAREGLFYKAGLPNLVIPSLKKEKFSQDQEQVEPEEGVEPEAPEEMGEEDEIAPEEEAPSPGGKKIKPGAEPSSGGPTLNGTPDTTDTEEGEELGEEDESEAARQLADEKRAAATKGGSDKSLEQEGVSEEEVGAPQTGGEVQEEQSQRIAKRELEAQKRAAELEGEEGSGEEPWEQKILKGWMKPVPGTLFYWWISVGDVFAIFVGEIFEASASWAYINGHAFLSLLPLKIGRLFPDAPEFEKLSWREWTALGIVNLIMIGIVLGSLVGFYLYIYFSMYPWMLFKYGYAELFPAFFKLYKQYF